MCGPYFNAPYVWWELAGPWVGAHAGCMYGETSRQKTQACRLALRYSGICGLGAYLFRGAARRSVGEIRTDAGRNKMDGCLTAINKPSLRRHWYVEGGGGGRPGGGAYPNSGALSTGGILGGSDAECYPRGCLRISPSGLRISASDLGFP